MIQYMFDKSGDNFVFKGSEEPVTVLHQGYFVTVSDGKKYASEGTDWDKFYKTTLSLLIGNDVNLTYLKQGR